MAREPTHAEHLLLEGFLLRLARHPDAEGFALRGGMRMRQWFGDRSAQDVDLVWLGDSLEGLRSTVGDVSRTPCPDGVRYEWERFRVEDIVAQGQQLGARVVAAGWVDGMGADFTVDIHRRLPIGTAPVRRKVRRQVRSARGTGHVWMCEPETLIGRKVVVTARRARNGGVRRTWPIFTGWCRFGRSIAIAWRARSPRRSTETTTLATRRAPRSGPSAG